MSTVCKVSWEISECEPEEAGFSSTPLKTGRTGGEEGKLEEDKDKRRRKKEIGKERKR